MGMPAFKVKQVKNEGNVAATASISITVGDSVDHAKAYQAFVLVRPATGAYANKWIDGSSYFAIEYKTDGTIQATNKTSSTTFYVILRAIKLYGG